VWQSQKPGDVVIQLGRQRTGVQLVEVDKLDEIHELGRSSVERVVQQTFDVKLSATV